MAHKRSVERKDRMIEYLKKENDSLKAENVFLSGKLQSEENKNKKLRDEISSMGEFIEEQKTKLRKTKLYRGNLQSVSELLILLRNDFLKYK